MAILTLDANTTATVGAGSSHSFAHTCTGLPDRALFLVVCLGSGTAFTGTVTATYNGVAMTKVGEVQNAGANYATVALFYLVNPASGSNTVAVSWTGSAVGCFVARSYTGVHQGVPVFPGSWTSTTGVGVGSTSSLSVTSTPGDIVLDGIAIWNSGAITAGGGQTEVLNTTSSTLRGGASVEAGATSVTMSWSVPAAVNAHAACSIHAAQGKGGLAISPSMIF